MSRKCCNPSRKHCPNVNRRIKGEYDKLRHGASSPRTGRSFDPERVGGTSKSAFHDEHDRRAGLLPKRILRLSDRARTFSECESDSGISTSVEADAKMEVSLAPRELIFD